MSRDATSSGEPPSIEAGLRSHAAELGFDAVGIARVDDVPPELAARLEHFLGEGAHGDMDWLQHHADRRGHPSRLWPQARSLVMLAMSYRPDEDPLAALADRGRGVLSVYAKGRDYHEVIKPKLKRLAGRLAREAGADVKVFVDTAPLMEKPLAARAGIGWQGRHTNLVSRTHGSWLFLGAILTTAELLPDIAQADHCGSCRRCLDVCPTDAFPAPYRLDARRCISYLTIEHKGPIDRALRPLMGNRIYGCDDCLAVCPWNKFAVQAREIRFKARPETDNPPLAELLELDDAGFRIRFAGTPIKRTGRDRFLRNVLIAAGNSGEPALISGIEKLLADPAPIVRGAAVWALARLTSKAQTRAHAAHHSATETDPGVLEEWREALAP
jgi:epoxyqueuosine reductase